MTDRERIPNPLPIFTDLYIVFPISFLLFLDSCQKEFRNVALGELPSFLCGASNALQGLTLATNVTSLPCANGSCAARRRVEFALQTSRCRGTRQRDCYNAKSFFLSNNPSPASRELPLHKGAFFMFIYALSIFLTSTTSIKDTNILPKVTQRHF